MLKLTFRMCCKTLFVTKEVLVRHRSVSRESLQCRILNYFETARKSQQKIQQCEAPMQVQLRDTGPDINDDFKDNKKENKLDNIFRDMKLVAFEKDLQLVEMLISKIDMQCVSLINSLTFSEILSLMTEYSKVAPFIFINSYFYHKCIAILMKAANEKSLSNHEMIQLLYFVSLDKENGANCIEYLKPLLPDMNDLPLFEKCITAQSFYITSTELQLRQSRLLEESIDQDIEQLMNDATLLVTLCKAVISNNPSEELTLKNLSTHITESEKPLNFNSTAYILNLYSKILIFEPKPIDKLVKFGINSIIKDLKDNKKTIDIADLDTFLWSLSNLGLILTMQEKLLIRKYVEQRLNEYTTKENLGYFVNSILSMHLLRNWSTKMILFCFREQIFEPIFHGHKFHWKVQAKLQLLLSQIRLEMKMKIPSKLLKQTKIGFTPSKNLITVQEVGFGLADKKIIKDAIIECPIKTLIIPGVTITTENETYHIDVLDKLTCLRKTNIPNGLTNLKLRLLSRLRYRQILIPGQIFEENPEKAQFIIEKKIRDMIKYGRASERLYN